MKRCLTTVILLALIAQITPLVAQTPPASIPPVPQIPSVTAPADDDEVVRITTNLIQFDVTVTDKNGQPVPDLTPEDFEIFENDKRQDISNFSYIALASRLR